MLHLDADTKYYWFQGTADFRKDFNGLCGLVKKFCKLMSHMVAFSSFYVFLFSCGQYWESFRVGDNKY